MPIEYHLVYGKLKIQVNLLPCQMMQRTLILRLYKNDFTADITIPKNRSQTNNLKLQQESKGSKGLSTNKIAGLRCSINLKAELSLPPAGKQGFWCGHRVFRKQARAVITPLLLVETALLEYFLWPYLTLWKPPLMSTRFRAFLERNWKLRTFVAMFVLPASAHEQLNVQLTERNSSLTGDETVQTT